MIGAHPPRIVVGCLDVGSPKKGNVGWAVLADRRSKTGHDLEGFVDAIATYVYQNRPVAVGFECPLYVPLRSNISEMTQARRGEVGVNWCGGPGSSVLAVGLVQVNWVLRELGQRIRGVSGTTRWSEFVATTRRLFFWEAFITSRTGVVVRLDAHDSRSAHERDALCGALAFRRKRPVDGDLRSDLEVEPALSLIGLHLLQTGLSDDLSLLSHRCTVLKIRKPK